MPFLGRIETNICAYQRHKNHFNTTEAGKQEIDTGSVQPDHLEPWLTLPSERRKVRARVMGKSLQISAVSACETRPQLGSQLRRRPLFGED